MIETIRNFAKVISGVLNNDRYVLLVCDGETGEGKSCFTSQLAEEVSKYTNTHFSYKDNMTYKRSELKLWVDGDSNGKNQKPEKTSILADEIISMFFKRNWFEADQIDGIELLNKCRDRHLLILGNIPNFWDLDSAIYPLANFWVHIHQRGQAWVFQKDRNPFTTDKWHRTENQKRFLKFSDPSRCKGYVCEIRYNDWTPEKKTEYYAVRNEKRKHTEGQRMQGYKNLKYARNSLLSVIVQNSRELLQLTKNEVVKNDPDLLSKIQNLVWLPKDLEESAGISARNIQHIVQMSQSQTQNAAGFSKI